MLKRFSKEAANLRSFRTLHRWIGLFLAIFLLISSLTGLLLAWKKDVEILQPPTQKSVHKADMNWLPVDSLRYYGQAALAAHLKVPFEEVPVNRLDVRPSKGIAKVLFENGWWEVQVDGQTGETLSVARRHSDWIEALHDGSIISDPFKLVSMTTLGIGLLFLTVFGVILWYGPRKIRKLKDEERAAFEKNKSNNR